MDPPWNPELAPEEPAMQKRMIVTPQAVDAIVFALRKTLRHPLLPVQGRIFTSFCTLHINSM